MQLNFAEQCREQLAGRIDTLPLRIPYCVRAGRRVRTPFETVKNFPRGDGWGKRVVRARASWCGQWDGYGSVWGGRVDPGEVRMHVL